MKLFIDSCRIRLQVRNLHFILKLRLPWDIVISKGILVIGPFAILKEG
jgi:hypothetical protein